MAHIPFGYEIVDGRAVVNPEKKEKLERLFELYNSGIALKAAGDELKLGLNHPGVARLISNKVYLGTDFYPQIIDEETFERAGMERLKRAKALGRIHDYSHVKEEKRVRQRYFLGEVEKKFSDPFKQAAFAYSQIGSEGK